MPVWKVCEGICSKHQCNSDIRLQRADCQDSILARPEGWALLVMEATNTLARLLKTRYKLGAHEGKGIKDAITSVLTELAIPLGVNLGGKFAD